LCTHILKQAVQPNNISAATTSFEVTVRTSFG
jgi:hypothetical protein